ncbi:MAG: DUF3445 domain-containing protein [Rhodobacteraceae bacterium]|nr:DUF3445 domain-containing protein [Paracoccaceae bacterium]
MTAVLQTSLPYDIWAPRTLPGVAPLGLDDWLIRDEAFGGQMATRDHLLQTRRGQVLQMDELARAPAVELLEMVLRFAWPEAGAQVTRCDGVEVVVNRDDPLGTLCGLVQEDFCILQKLGDQHVLTGAIVCFPASWRLDEKFMAPLIGIHSPVGEYDTRLATRVQRLFDGVKPGRPLWRFNALWYDDPTLFQPRGTQAPRTARDAGQAAYLRSEKQSILRLPETGAVVFSIHTYVLDQTSVLPPRP